MGRFYLEGQSNRWDFYKALYSAMCLGQCKTWLSSRTRTIQAKTLSASWPNSSLTFISVPPCCQTQVPHSIIPKLAKTWTNSVTLLKIPDNIRCLWCCLNNPCEHFRSPSGVPFCRLCWSKNLLKHTATTKRQDQKEVVVCRRRWIRQTRRPKCNTGYLSTPAQPSWTVWYFF